MPNMLLENPDYKVLTLVASLVLMYGCEQSERGLGELGNEEICKMLKIINVTDGIDQNEAAVLAEMYFRRFSPSGGGSGVLRLVEMQDYWESLVIFGYVGQPWGSIKIDKKTARMSWERGPTIEDPVGYFCSKGEK